MAIIQPFKALRPRPGLASRVASRPYDVLNSMEAKEEALGNPLSFYHVSKPEIDLPTGSDPHSPEVYQKAGENLERFIREGILQKEGSPCYYIYELTMEGKVQTGLTAVSSLDDYDSGIIKKHELTRPDKEMDRVKHMLASGAQTGNVLLAFNDIGSLDQIMRSWTEAHSPLYDFTASDCIHHRLWIVDAKDTIGQITTIFFREVPFTYIADGHHRAAAASIVRKTLAEQGRISSAQEPVNFFLTTLFPASQLTILDYNRVVKDLNGMSPAEFLNRLQTDFEVGEASDSHLSPGRLHEFSLYLSKKWYRLHARPESYDQTPLGMLDVNILQYRVLDKLLDIKDQRTDSRVDFIGGIRGLEELARRVDSGEMQAAFALNPVTTHQLFDIADSGQIMPPKSTWFEPKLRDGLVTHSLS